MHSPIKDLALSGFTEVMPLERPAEPPRSFAARVRARLAEWRHRVRSQNELAQLTDRDWDTGDYGISRWQAEAVLRTPFWTK